MQLGCLHNACRKPDLPQPDNGCQANEGTYQYAFMISDAVVRDTALRSRRANVVAGRVAGAVRAVGASRVLQPNVGL
jgi:hypothetical protein